MNLEEVILFPEDNGAREAGGNRFESLEVWLLVRKRVERIELRDVEQHPT